MEQVTNILKNNTPLYLATSGEDNHPHVRPFGVMMEKDGRLYFSTSSKTSAFQDLQQNPYAEVSVTT